MTEGATDEEIAEGVRAWLELPADASVGQMLDARPGRVAVDRRLRAELEPIDFIETLLLSAKDERSMELICSEIRDALHERHPATKQTIFDLSDEEPWTTLSLHIFGSDSYEESDGSDDSEPWEPLLNLAQAAEAYVWMGGELEPGENHEDRYHDGAMGFIQHHLGIDEDPIPLLRFLRGLAQTESELDHVLIGAFEDAIHARREHKERILEITPFGYVEHFRTL